MVRYAVPTLLKNGQKHTGTSTNIFPSKTDISMAKSINHIKISLSLQNFHNNMQAIFTFYDVSDTCFYNGTVEI